MHRQVAVWLLFLMAVAITGGASRYDAIQILPLRAIAAMALALSFLDIDCLKLRSNWPLLAFFTALIVIVGVQVIPVPVDFWERGLARDLKLVGHSPLEASHYRPLSLAPLRTWNALASLIVPAAAIMLAISYTRTASILLKSIAFLGVLSAALGLIQVASGPTSPLYFYEITNRGSAVGIFANENHAAVFGAVAMLILAYLFSTLRGRSQSVVWKIVYSAGFLMIFLVNLVTGSRAGFITALFAMTVSLLLLSLGVALRLRSETSKSLGGVRAKLPLLLILPLMVASGLVLLFIVAGRAPAFVDIVSQDGLADLRWSLWPVLQEMFATYWLFGSGFGSFEQVYQLHEPQSLLMPKYVNQAHNDWIQFAIEGGLGAMILLIAFVAWVLWSMYRLWAAGARVPLTFWVSVFAVVGGASLVDYPLRSPAFQVIAMLMIVALYREIRAMNAD
ncbi:hypothetical protein CHH26_06810 [Qipengyuania flava]|nr:hypothetical protein CHH26_06810 [Qipengyuania flava]